MTYLKRLNRCLCRLGTTAYGISILAEPKEGQEGLKLERLRVRLKKLANQVIEAHRLLNKVEEEQ
jgi:hypothetical protein